MLIVDLEPELESSLHAVAQQIQLSPSEIVKQLVQLYLKKQQDNQLLGELVELLPQVTCFGNQNPLEIQQALRNEWH